MRGKPRSTNPPRWTRIRARAVDADDARLAVGERRHRGRERHAERGKRPARGRRRDVQQARRRGVEAGDLAVEVEHDHARRRGGEHLGQELMLLGEADRSSRRRSAIRL